MACPTCDHTMQNLGVENQKIFWCPRCGTLKTISPSGDYEENSETIFTKKLMSIGICHLKHPIDGKSQEILIQADFLLKQNNLEKPLITLHGWKFVNQV